MTEYHKIETLYNRGEDFKVKVGEFRNPVYSIIKTWHWTEKVDGTNMRFIWENGELRIGGRTDKSQIPGDLVQWMRQNVTWEQLKSVFPDQNAVLYGEGYGAGIQKAGVGYGPTKKFILFDVLVDGRWWLDQPDIEDVGSKLGLDTVPYLGEMTLDDATEMTKTGFKSQIVGADVDAEGMVGRPVSTLYDKRGNRLIVKLKTKDF